MIVKDEFLSKLRRYFNLNLYEVKIWAALLSRGVSTAGELSDIANVPRSRSYDVLESLEKKGFVVMKLGKPIKYIAVPPNEAIERVKKRIKNEAEEQEKELEQLKKSETMNELSILHTQGIETQDPSELTGSIRGRSNIYDHLAYQIKGAKESIVISTTEAGFIRKSKLLLKHLKKAKARGVDITISAPIPESGAGALAEYATLKNNPDIKSRFCIVDKSKLTMMLTDDSKVHPSYDLAIWVESPLIADTLASTLN